MARCVPELHHWPVPLARLERAVLPAGERERNPFELPGAAVTRGSSRGVSAGRHYRPLLDGRVTCGFVQRRFIRLTSDGPGSRPSVIPSQDQRTGARTARRTGATGRHGRVGAAQRARSSRQTPSAEAGVDPATFTCSREAPSRSDTVPGAELLHVTLCQLSYSAVEPGGAELLAPELPQPGTSQHTRNGPAEAGPLRVRSTEAACPANGVTPRTRRCVGPGVYPAGRRGLTRRCGASRVHLRFVAPAGRRLRADRTPIPMRCP